ncbi:MAG TPA: hypothetical protein VIH38_04375, partial [Steroidobacteraceae bacterium]
MAQSYVGRVYRDTAAELLEYAGDAGAGVARYTFPAWPVGLNGERAHCFAARRDRFRRTAVDSNHLTPR